MVTISIVTYHTDIDELNRCLQSLSSPLINRVYIVDNGCEERLRIWAQRNSLVYLQANNPGFGAAHNIAIRSSLDSGTDYHLVLNSDVYFDPEVIDRLHAFMDTHPQVGMVQPKVLYPDGSRQYTCRRLPTPIDVFGRRFLPQRVFARRNNKYLLKELDSTLSHNIPYHQGSFMFFRAEALKDTGLFDERFFMYPEDIDITRRVHRRWQTLYYPDCSIIHCHRAESYKSMRMTWIHVTNMIRYFNKWGWFIDRERRLFNSRIR